MLKAVAEKISPFPLWQEARGYSGSLLRSDLLAALSLALMTLPQAIAYAFVAGLPVSAGIFSAVFGTIFTASFGSSRTLISGPTNTVAILIQSGTAEILYTYYRTVQGEQRELLALQIVLALTLIVGILQILGGLLKLGRVTQFASRPVIIGYTAGAALAIVVSQAFFFFGISEGDKEFPLYRQGFFLLEHLKMQHTPTMLIGLGCLLLLFFLQRLSLKIPSAVIVFTLAGLVVYLFNLSPNNAPGLFDIDVGQKVGKVTLLEDIGPLPTRLPEGHFPFFDLHILIKLVPLGCAIALLSILEVTAIGRSYAGKEFYSDNQQIYGLGVSNFLSSFLGGMPSSGSFSRTALNVEVGGKTRFAPIFSGLILFIIVISLQWLVMKIPLSALSALMLLTAYAMVNFKDLFVCFKATMGDAIVLVVTFVSSILYTLDVALYIGVALSIALYLKRASTPDLVEYSFTPVGKLRPIEEEDERPDPRICILQPEGELFFASIDLFQTRLRKIAENENIVVIIFQLINTRYIDATACLALKQFNEFLKGRGGHLLMAGVGPEVAETMRSASVFEAIGRENIFPANERVPSLPTREAYAAAKSILPCSNAGVIP